MESKNAKIIKYKNSNVHSISFALIVAIGSIHEPIAKCGITHLIEHMTFRKAGQLIQNEIYTKCEKLGVFIHASTGKEFIKYDFICRKEVFNQIILLFSEMFYENDYTQKDLALEKGVVLAEIDKREYSYAEELVSFLWNKDEYRNITLGDRDSIHNISLTDIKNYKNSILNHEHVLFIVGNYSEQDLRLVQKLFRKSLLLEKPNKPFNFKSVEKAIKKVNFIQEKNYIFDIYYTYHVILNDNDRTNKIILMQMLESILFQGNAAYFNESMREKTGYVYDFDSFINICNDELVFIFSFTTNKIKVVEAINEIEKELVDFSVNDDYLQYIRAFFCDNNEMIYDSVRDCLNDYVSNYIHFKDLISPKRYSEIISNLKKEDYNEFFKDLALEKKVFICGNADKKLKKRIKIL